MTTPSPRFSINGFGVGEMAIVAAGTPIVATLENTAGVQPVTWRVASTDELHDGGDYSFAQSGSLGEVFTGAALTAGTSGALECTVAGGINPATQLPDNTLTYRVKWVVLTAEGLAVLTAGEVEGDALSSASHGAVAVLNAAIRVTAAAADRAIGAGVGTANAVVKVDAAGTTLSRSGVTSDGAGSLTLGTDGGGRPALVVSSSTVGRSVILGTNEVTQIPPTVDTIWGLTFNRTVGSLSWGDHTKPAAGDFNELIWDPGLGELREERYHETGNHILDRMDRQWGSTMSYTTGLAQWSFAVTDCVWVDELQVTSWAHMQNGHLRLGGSSPGDSALVITQAAETGGGVPAGIAYTAGAHTNLQTGTDAPDVFFALARTKTHAAGALPNNTGFYVTAPTTAFAGASTVSKDYTVWFNGAPAAGANCTQTDKGALRVTGDLLVEGTSKLDATNTGYAFHAFVSATDGFRAVHNGTRSWGFDPVSGNDNVLSFGVGVIWSGLGGNVLPNLLMRAGYGADATYPAMNLENRNAATNVLEHWGPAIVEKHRAWNTGGTPASEEWVWTSQKTSVQGAPSTAFYDVKAARAGGAAQNVLHLPGQPVTITGMTLAQLITQLTVNFPFYA